MFAGPIRILIRKERLRKGDLNFGRYKAVIVAYPRELAHLSRACPILVQLCHAKWQLLLIMIIIGLANICWKYF